MVNTFLAHSDQALKEEFERFAKDKLGPIASELVSGKEVFFKQLAQAGYLGLNVPLAFGGKDSPLMHVVLLAEALAGHEPGAALYLAYHTAVIELIKAYGSDQQKTTYLSKLAQGQLLGALAYLELPESTSNNGDLKQALKQDISPLNNLKANIVIKGDNVILTGKKELVVLGSLPSINDQDNNPPAMPNLALVFTNTGFIAIDNLSAPAIKIKKQKISMGLEALSLASLTFDNYSTNKNNYFAAENSLSADPGPDKALAFARAIIKTIMAAAALGMSERVLYETTDHAKISERGGKALAQSEAIQWKLADAAADTNAARLLTYRAAWSKDEDRDNFLQYAAMSKAYATKVARFHTGEGLQIILPFLQNVNSPLPRFYLDSKMLETYDATNEEEKVLLSELLGI